MNTKYIKSGNITVTSIKPSEGNFGIGCADLIVSAKSSGIHPRFNQTYIKRVRINEKTTAEARTQECVEQGI